MASRFTLTQFVQKIHMLNSRWHEIETILRELVTAEGIGDGKWDMLCRYLTHEPVWTDKTVALSHAKRLGSSDPAYKQLADNGADSVGVYVTAFEAGFTQEVLFDDLQLPHSYKPGTDTKLHVHWVPGSATTGDIILGVEYVIINKDQAFGNTIVTEVTIPAPGNTEPQLDPMVTISGATLVESSVILCRFYRKGNDALDTYSGDVFTNSIDLHFQQEKPGTAEEYPGERA